MANEEANEKLYLACCGNSGLEAVKNLIEQDKADAFYQNEADGKSCLMAAAQHGNLEVVSALLLRGAPWNALDRAGLTAGDYAVNNGHQEVVDKIVNHATMCEMILGAIERGSERDHAKKQTSKNYLERSVRYDSDKLMDSGDDAVMMEWETPIMQAHAELMCSEGRGHVLNIGFGMGIIDTALQTHKPENHTIVEAHPDVWKKMLADGWDKKEGVRIIFGKWQDVLPKIKERKYDGIFFDTYGEYYSDMQEFHAHLPELLMAGSEAKPSIYTFFNGLCPDNIFCHGVICQVVKLELESLGFSSVDFWQCQIIPPTNEWDGVKRKYWHGWETYYLPVCTFLGPTSSENTDESSSSSEVGKRKRDHEEAAAS
jgi:protein arginine N-methyltransferase 2